eukprot:5463851-Pyramimonas_sp.AAC.1
MWSIVGVHDQGWAERAIFGKIRFMNYDGARAYSHDGPSRRRKCGYILTLDQSDAGSAGVFSRWTDRRADAPPAGCKRKFNNGTFLGLQVGFSKMCINDGPIR